MPIREGSIENSFLSDKTYLTVFVEGEIKGVPQRKTLEKDILFSEYVNNFLNGKMNLTVSLSPLDLKIIRGCQ